VCHILIVLNTSGGGVRHVGHKHSDQAILRFRREARGDLLFG
jgi:hypothetical protein